MKCKYIQIFYDVVDDDGVGEGGIKSEGEIHRKKNSQYLSNWEPEFFLLRTIRVFKRFF